MKAENPRFVCIGGAVIDRKIRAAEPIRHGTSNPATSSLGFGGVARNVAENLARLGGDVSFASCIGDDAAGRAMIEHLGSLGVDVASVQVITGAATAEYTAFLEPDGTLFAGAADMAVLDGIYDVMAAGLLSGLQRDAWVFADCNAGPEALREVIGRCARAGSPLAIDAISAAKARRLPPDLGGVTCLFLNRDEAAAVLGAAEAGDPAQMALALAGRGANAVVLTLGEDGALVCEGGRTVHLPAERARVAEVTGAGDAMIAGTWFGLAQGLDLAKAAQLGIHVAARTVASALSVDETLSPAVAEQLIAGFAPLRKVAAT